MNLRPFQQVDVFTDTPYCGNPLAVVLDGQGLSDAQMLQFANWTHLSETTFLLPPTPEGAAAGADYRVRIFTPGVEMQFAGHPTLGSCHAWLHAGHQPRRPGMVVQECGVGLVTIQRHATHLAFAAPPLQRSAPALNQLAQVCAALGLKHTQVRAAQTLDNGTVWLGLWLDSATTVLQIVPDHHALQALGVKVGVVGEHSSGDALSPASDQAPDVEVRAFAACVGVPEDPVTGSLNASLAQWLMMEGLMPSRYVAAQGRCLGRSGRVSLQADEAGQVWVGGQAVTCIDGQVTL